MAMVWLEDDPKHILDRGNSGLGLRREERFEKALIRAIKCIKERPQSIRGKRADKRGVHGPGVVNPGRHGNPRMQVGGPNFVPSCVWNP